MRPSGRTRSARARPAPSASKRTDLAHDQVGDLAQQGRVDLAAAVGGQVDGRPAADDDGLARQRAEALPVAVVDLAGAPVHHRQHRHVRGQGEAGHAGAGVHRPLVGVAADGALRVDHDDLAVGQGPRAFPEAALGVGGLAVHRDLPGAAQRLAEHGHAPEAVLGQEPRHPPGPVHDQAAEHRVEVREVVGDDQRAAARRDVLQPLEPRPAHQPARGVEEDRAERDPEPTLLAPHAASLSRSRASLPGRAPSVHPDRWQHDLLWSGWTSSSR